jgi:hypothetical protein
MGIAEEGRQGILRSVLLRHSQETMRSKKDKAEESSRRINKEEE